MTSLISKSKMSKTNHQRIQNLKPSNIPFRAPAAQDTYFKYNIIASRDISTVHERTSVQLTSPSIWVILDSHPQPFEAYNKTSVKRL